LKTIHRYPALACVVLACGGIGLVPFSNSHKVLIG
jgi:hypothetical protein